MGQERQRRKAVVFLDANIPGTVIFPLRDLVRAAHWISFWAPRDFVEKDKDRSFFATTPDHWRRIKSFFDLTGDINVFGPEACELNPPVPPVSPNCMGDSGLISYMTHLRAHRFSGRKLYIFYTSDRKLLRREDVLASPLFSEFEASFTVCTIRVSWDRSEEREKQSVVEEMARQIRHDLETRLQLPCRCHYR